ncbi:hypothetical protein F5Y19DRAFT_91780 [Xylariaceae sp. FL1651]|nr:hypothetical protein F5Y19DRAFT_91780 [Xylariaceae sp. FL1651]
MLQSATSIMAEPLSLGASIVAFIELAERVIRTCKYCIETIQNAPQDMQMIFGEVTSLRAIFVSLGAANLHPNTVRSIPTLLGTGGPIESCRLCLSALEQLLPTYDLNISKGRRVLTELAWPLKESKARKLLAEISQHKSTLLLAITGDVIHDIKDIRAGVERIEYVITDSQRTEIIRWLQCTDPSPLHNGAFQKHEEHTSAWLLKTHEWNVWLRGEQSERFLWIHGIPGAGKTVLISFIIEHLKHVFADMPDVVQAFYYCHHSHGHGEATRLLRWTIGQLCRKTQSIPWQVKELYDEGCDPTISKLLSGLELLVKKVRVFYIVVDAVDESQPRSELLTLIKTLATDQRYRNLRILASSRLYPDIREAFSDIAVPLSMSNSAVEEDIRKFIQCRLASSRHLQKWKYLFKEIEKALAHGAQGMFRWTDCQLQVLERLRSEEQIVEALQKLPKDLAEVYTRVFEDIPENDRPFVRRTLIWISGHQQAPWLVDRGISASVLLPAVAYDLNHEKLTSSPFIYTLDDLEELCGCLITISRATNTVVIDSHNALSPTADETKGRIHQGHLDDHDNFFINLAHYTVAEFLSSSMIHETSVSYFALSNEEISTEFTRSVIRQALDADPEGSSTDYVRDCQAYCLTLGCALRVPEVPSQSNTIDFFIQYFNPARPHYRRFQYIQKKLARNVDESSYYYLQNLVTRNVGDALLADLHNDAITLINIGLAYNLNLLRAFLSQRQTKELSATHLSLTFTEISEDGDGVTEVLCEGTVFDIISLREPGFPFAYTITGGPALGQGISPGKVDPPTGI